MINLKFYLDKRHLKGETDRPASIKVVITRRRTTALLSTGVSVLPSQWDSSKNVIIDHPNSNRLNLHLSKYLISIQNIVIEMEENGLCAGMTAKNVKDYILSKISPKEAEADTTLFSKWFYDFLDSKENERTKSIYSATKVKIEKFYNDWEYLKLEDIDLNWLRAFDKFLLKSSNSVNTRAIHLRNIRAIFNYAITEGGTTFYPFRKFKIKHQQTIKRSFSTQQLRGLFSFQPSKYAEEGKDILMLTFFLCGINFIDLTNLKGGNIINGRIEYIRSKTKKPYSIKLEPEAVSIIEKYKGKDYLINMKERYAFHHDAISAVNHKIKALVEEYKTKGEKTYRKGDAVSNNTSTYWARHSWATTAAELDIPKETIAAGLGHSIGSPITSIYIDFNLKKVDEANRKIIDYILYNKV